MSEQQAANLVWSFLGIGVLLHLFIGWVFDRLGPNDPD
jgi:hypothetical protein